MSAGTAPYTWTVDGEPVAALAERESRALREHRAHVRRVELPVLARPYDPWQELIGLAGVGIIVENHNDWSGFWCHERQLIGLHPRLYRDERRSVLAHELTHVRLGHCGPQSAASEAAVREAAARRLISTSDLRRALSHELARTSPSLAVDRAAYWLMCRAIDVRVRLATLRPAEVRSLGADATEFGASLVLAA